MYSQIEDNIYRIHVELPNDPLKNLNAYVIKGADRNLLIDTGSNLEVCWNCLFQGLNELKISSENTDIFLTHFHSDHTGLAHRLVKNSTRLYISEKDECYWRFYGSDKGRQETINRYINGGFSLQELDSIIDSLRTAYAPELSGRSTYVYDGSLLEYGGRKLRAVSTPGHTPGHMCLIDDESEIMFLGDHVLFNITPNVTSCYGFANPLGHYLESLKKTLELKVRVPLPAHRTVHKDLECRIHEIMTHHNCRLDEILSLLRAFGPMNANHLASHMRWRINSSSNKWEDFPFRQRWFAVGEVKAHLEYLAALEQIQIVYADGVALYCLN